MNSSKKSTIPRHFAKHFGEFGYFIKFSTNKYISKVLSTIDS